MASVLEDLLSGKKGKDESEQYGIYHNEMSKLAEVVDTWDMIPTQAADPPFADVNTYIPWKVIPTTYGDVVLNYASLSQIQPGYTVALFGKRRSGKTMAMHAMMQQMRPWFRDVVVFTKTIASCEFNRYVPNTCIIDGLDLDLLERLLDRQKQRNIDKSNGHAGENDKLLLVFEDCMASGGLRGGAIFESLFYNGRHYETTILVALQDIKGLSPAVVQNCDLCYIFPLDDFRGVEALYEKWFYFLAHKKQCLELMMSPDVNKKYHMLTVDIAHKNHPPHQRLTYGAVDPESMLPFVMGDRKLWANDMGQLVGLIKLYGLPDLIHTIEWDVD